MIYKTYNCNSFNVHTIKTDNFKMCHMEIHFGHTAKKEDLTQDSFLANILAESSSKYKTRKEVATYLEDLYKATFYSVTTKLGKMLNTTFEIEFIDPKYTDEEDYLENVIKFPFEMLQNPNAINGEFDLKQFNLVKEKIKKEIESLNENPTKISIRRAFEAMDKDSPTTYPVLGTLADLEKITPSSLYELYKKFFKSNTCDIFIIGNLDMDEVVSIIRKHYKNRIINDAPRLVYVENEIKKKEILASSDSNYIQANLVMIYGLDHLTKLEKDITINVFNYILGSGGLTSKLYRVIREENSLCYSISSMFLKYDNLLLINMSLENDNVKKAISLAKKCIKSVSKGEFSEEDLKDAKQNLSLSLTVSLDNEISLINNYIFKVYDNLPSLEERKELISKVTKEEIMSVAKKIKPNTIYILNGGKK